MPALAHNVVNARAIVPIFLLPNIHTVCLGNLACANADGDTQEWDENILPTESSTVEHLFIENSWTDDVKYALKSFIQSSKALKSFVVKDCEFNDFDLTVQYLGEQHGNTLEIFMFANENGDLRGYRCSKFYPRDHADNFGAIRIFTVEMSDVLSTATFPHYHEADTYHRSVFNAFISAIPANTEVMIFRSVDERLDKDGLDAIVAALEGLSEDEDFYFPNLRTIYIDEILGLDHSRYRDVPKDVPTDEARRPRCDDLTLIDSYSKRMVEFGEQNNIDVRVALGSTRKYVAEVCNGTFDLNVT